MIVVLHQFKRCTQHSYQPAVAEPVVSTQTCSNSIFWKFHLPLTPDLLAPFSVPPRKILQGTALDSRRSFVNDRSPINADMPWSVGASFVVRASFGAASSHRTSGVVGPGRQVGRSVLRHNGDPPNGVRRFNLEPRQTHDKTRPVWDCRTADQLWFRGSM